MRELEPMPPETPTDPQGTSDPRIAALYAPYATRWFHPLDWLIVVLRHARRILVWTSTGAALAAAIALLMPDLYVGRATILPPQQGSSAASAVLGQLNALAGAAGKDLGLKNPNDLYVGMLRSRTIADALVRRFNLKGSYRTEWQDDARKRLEEQTTILSGKDGLITIAVEDRDPRRAAGLANAYVEELRALNQNLAVTESGQRRLFYETQLIKEKDALANAEVELRKVQEKTGLVLPDAQGRALVETIANVRAMIAGKEVQIQAMRSFAAPQNPDLVRAEQELAGLRAQLQKMQQGGGPEAEGIIPTSRIPAVGVEYVRRYRDVKYHEALFDILSRQYEAARIDEGKNAAVVQVLDPAEVPERRSKPRRTLIVLVGAGLGFLLSLARLWFDEWWTAWSAVEANRKRFQQLTELLPARFR
jgi:tyrosine-protein kinase Etk/Wzc